LFVFVFFVIFNAQLTLINNPKDRNIMRKSLLALVLLMVATTIFFTCSKNEDAGTNIVSKEIIAQFQAKGFNTEGIQKVGDQYLVEYCTLVSKQQLDQMTDYVSVPGPNGEQYRTYNLVTAPTTIKIKGPTSPAKINTAIDQAIARYNAQGLQIKFTRVTSGADITVKTASGSAGGVSGFPSNGKPYPSVTVYSNTTQYSQAVVTHVVVHELGHTIGFRHSDYFNRSLSCGIGGNEGASSAGAVLIPGTTAGFDAKSVMNLCFSTSSTGTFSSYDIIALDYLYQ
jgi:hypothetical protein